MKHFRQLHKQYLFVYIIALGMLVRTFIAPGFMLNTKTTNEDIGGNGFYAAITYSGRTNEKNFKKHKEILEKKLKEDNISIITSV